MAATNPAAISSALVYHDEASRKGRIRRTIFTGP